MKALIFLSFIFAINQTVAQDMNNSSPVRSHENSFASIVRAVAQFGTASGEPPAPPENYVESGPGSASFSSIGATGSIGQGSGQDSNFHDSNLIQKSNLPTVGLFSDTNPLQDKNQKNPKSN